MRQEAEAGVAVTAAEAAYRFQILRRDIVQAAHQLALADETLVIGAEDLALLDRMTGFARERQRAGLDSNLDLLRLENERGKRANQLETDRQQREFARATLNRLVARPQDAPWPALELPERAPAIPLSEQLFEMGAKFEPRLRVMRQDSAMAESGIEVARRSRRPDVAVGVAGRQWTGSGDFRKACSPSASTCPGSTGASTAPTSTAAMPGPKPPGRGGRLRTAGPPGTVSRLDPDRRRAARSRALRGQHPAAIRPCGGHRPRRLGHGRGMFLDVLETRRMLTEARLMRARAVVEQHQMIADLVTCCGVAELDSLMMLGVPAASPTPGSTPLSPSP